MWCVEKPSLKAIQREVSPFFQKKRKRIGHSTVHFDGKWRKKIHKVLHQKCLSLGMEVKLWEHLVMVWLILLCVKKLSPFCLGRMWWFMLTLKLFLTILNYSLFPWRIFSLFKLIIYLFTVSLCWLSIFLFLVFWPHPWPGMKPTPPALEGRVLITGLLGKSPTWRVSDIYSSNG